MKSIFLSLVICLLSYSAISQHKKDTSTVLKLSSLSIVELLNVQVYTATKKMQKISDAPAIICVVSRNDIEKMGVTSLIDVFKYVPGIETSMGSDGHYRLSIRGTRKDGNILMLINGQRVNNFYDGRAIYDLPINFIEKIEIIRGPGSSLFGTGAVAGVINIFTVNTNEITARLGTNNTFSGNVNYRIDKRNVQGSISVGYLQSDGTKTLIESDGAVDRSWSLTYADLKYKTQRWNKDAYINTNFVIGNLKLNMFAIDRQQGAYVGPLYIASPGSKLVTKELLGSVSYDYKVNDVVVITPKVYSNLIGHNYLTHETPDNYISNTSGNVFTGGKQTLEKYNCRTIGAELAINIKVNEQFNILAGEIFEKLSLPNYDLTRNYQIVGDEYKSVFNNFDNISRGQKGKHRDVFASFLQGNYTWKKINICAGIRHDDYSDFGQSVNPRLGITYNASKIIRFKGLYGKAFRAPTFQELYDNTNLGNQYGVKGNEKLKPEIIQTIEFGTEISYKKIIFRYNVFYNLNKNLIRIYDSRGGGSIGIYENIGNVNTYGHEAEATVVLSPKFNFFINASQFVSVFDWNTENIKKADIIFFNKESSCNKQLKNIPTIRANAGFSMDVYKFRVFVGLNYGSMSQNNKRFYLEENEFVKIPSYLQGNFNISYQINNKIKIQLAANNLGKKYSDPDESTNINAFGQSGLLQPTETFLLGASYKFNHKN